MSRGSDGRGWRIAVSMGRCGTLVVAIGLTFSAVALGGTAFSTWPSAGGDTSDTHSSSDTTAPSTSTVSTLAPYWGSPFTNSHGTITATPAVVGGVIYFPDSGGYLEAVDAGTGALEPTGETNDPIPNWTAPQIASYTSVTGDYSKTAPAVADGNVYIGSAGNITAGNPTDYLMAFNATTGAPAWTPTATQLDSDTYATLLSSPVVVNGITIAGAKHNVVFEGVSSREEHLTATGHPYKFQGSIVAVDATNGKILWKTSTVCPNTLTSDQSLDGTTQYGLGVFATTFTYVPSGGSWSLPSCGYTGGAIWSSTAAYDARDNLVFVTTGNNYSVPAGVTASNVSGSDYDDSMMALNASTGAVVWAAPWPPAFDLTNQSCYGKASCPGLDYDFGTGPSLLTINHTMLVGAGSKSGDYWIFLAKNGAVVHHIINLGPGGPSGGGIDFGAATDGATIYVGENNSPGGTYPLQGAANIAANKKTPNSSWAAINPVTGVVLWQQKNNLYSGAVSNFLTVANGVLYAPTYGQTCDSNKTCTKAAEFRALNAADGTCLWTFDVKGVNSQPKGVAISDSKLFWAVNNELYAFYVPTNGTSSNCAD